MPETALNIHDCGELRGDVLVFGGPYSNSQAAEALLSEATARGIARSNLICTGDVMAYGADPAKTWELVAANCATVVAGNCEMQLGAGAAECGCGFEDGSACDLASRGWFAHADAQAGPYRAALQNCPDIAVFTHAGRCFAVIHGGATDIARFIWPDAAEAVFQEEIAAIEAACGPVDGVFCGHSGIGFQRYIGACHWINSGVIGMPPHDGRPETRFAILSSDGVILERLSYGHNAAAMAMEAAGLTQGYHQSLRSGVWPNEDVLPQSLRR